MSKQAFAYTLATNIAVIFKSIASYLVRYSIEPSTFGYIFKINNVLTLLSTYNSPLSNKIDLESARVVKKSNFRNCYYKHKIDSAIFIYICIILIAFCIVVLIVPAIHSYKIIFILCLTHIFLQIDRIDRLYFKNVKNDRKLLHPIVVISLITSLTVIYIAFEFGVIGYLGVNLAGACATCYYIRKNYSIRTVKAYKYYKRLIRLKNLTYWTRFNLQKNNILFLIHKIGQQFLSTGEQWVLIFFQSENILGQYSMSVLVVTICSGFPTNLSSALIPKLAKNNKNEKEQFYNYKQTVLKVILTGIICNSLVYKVCILSQSIWPKNYELSLQWLPPLLIATLPLQIKNILVTTGLLKNEYLRCARLSSILGFVYILLAFLVFQNMSIMIMLYCLTPIRMFILVIFTVYLNRNYLLFNCCTIVVSSIIQYLTLKFI